MPPSQVAARFIVAAKLRSLGALVARGAWRAP
jgi:hypothetical protein